MNEPAIEASAGVRGSPPAQLISYCTNVHPAEDLAGVCEQLDRYAGPIRQRLGVDELGVGLWLPAPLAAELAANAYGRDRLADRLTSNGLTVRTLNAFPYAGFHAEVVKKAVYRPRWGDPARSEYTVHCAEVLGALLAEGAAGSLSTLPLGWREDWSRADDEAATAALAEVCASLRTLHESTGRRIRLAIEPEPGCALDTIADVVDWLGPRVQAGALDPDYLGVCVDTCHLAVSYADPAAEIEAIRAAGLQVVKIQASAAPEVPDPADPAHRAAIAQFVESRYLHQTRERASDGIVLGADDLDEALTLLPAAGPWRVHFHIPIHTEPAPPLRSTRASIVETLRALAGQSGTADIDVEVETYTWGVLPPETAGVDLVTGITEEMRWLTAAVRKEWA